MNDIGVGNESLGKTLLATANRDEALLWAAPTGPPPAPPIDTRPQVLPIGKLGWPDAERLFLRLLDAVRPVQYAKLFGVPGQAQAGIDAYARLPLELTGSGTGGRDYITLQSRKVKSLTAARIKKAVDDLLKGEWADKTSAFFFATSFDLQDAKLDVAIRQQTERLAGLNIAFVPWGVQEVSGLLKEHPRLVDDFFGRAWAERFCGPEAARALACNLPRQDSSELRAGLRDLYQAVFFAQGEARPAGDPEPGRQFVVLDVDPSRQQSEIISIELPEHGGEGQDPAQGPVDGQAYIASRLGGADSLSGPPASCSTTQAGSLPPQSARSRPTSGWPEASAGCWSGSREQASPAFCGSPRRTCSRPARNRSPCSANTVPTCQSGYRSGSCAATWRRQRRTRLSRRPRPG